MANLLRYLDQDYVKGTQESQTTWKSRTQALLTTLRVPIERRRAARIARDNFGELDLHIGCGGTYLDGWINIDLVSPQRRRDICWDLKRGLPFPNGSVRSIFSEHLLEHIPLPSALHLLKECLRALGSGGVIRIGVPDLERYANAYFGKDSIIDDVRPNHVTRAIAFSELFYFHGHRSAYDAETLQLLLRTAGFTQIVRSEFGRSIIAPCPDSESRRAETLYVEAKA